MVKQVFDGDEATERLKSEYFNIVILDIMLPGINGFDVCKKLKGDENFKDIPVVMLTGRSEPDDVQIAKNIGADAYFTKPFELDMLLYEVNALLRAKKKKSEQQQ